MDTPIVGRSDELRQLFAVLDGNATGARAIILRGEAGIGKTTIWRACVRHAQELGLRALVAQPAESESELPYAALGEDLLDPVVEEAAVLPEPQREALDLPLKRSYSAEPVTRLAVSRAVADLLRALSAERALIVAIAAVRSY